MGEGEGEAEDPDEAVEDQIEAEASEAEGWEFEIISRDDTAVTYRTRPKRNSIWRGVTVSEGNDGDIVEATCAKVLNMLERDHRLSVLDVVQEVR